MSQLTLARFLKLIDPRPHDPGRGPAQVMRASDIILLMMVALLMASSSFVFYMADRAIPIRRSPLRTGVLL